MNRKTKKRIKIVAVALFFLSAGIGFFLWSNFYAAKESGAQLTGVLELTEQELPEKELQEQEEPDKTVLRQENLVVYVCGAVNAPGIYTLSADSRLYEAVALAGGFSSEADPAYHNLARCISDGERIYILSSEETKLLSAKQQVAGEEGAERSPENGLINLNTATAEQLMELPGIGEAKAKGILDYRAKIGQFTAIEEIMNVSGIGEAMFEKIKDKITVK